MRRQRSGGWVGPVFGVAAAFGSAVLGQSSDVGLSAVGAQRFGSPEHTGGNVTGRDELGTALAVGDFNGDGADDLAAGAPGHDGEFEPEVNECGRVLVRYGVAGSGLAPGLAPTVLGQFVGPFPSHEAGDRFGHAVTACNLNGDPYDDLVVGVPDESVTAGIGLEYPYAGLIEVYYGTANGIVPPASTTRREAAAQGLPVAGSRFGFALACGDFNWDGFDDLVVGLPERELGAFDNAGRIHVFPGSASGIAAAALVLDQDSAGMLDQPESDDYFGYALATGDWDGDDYADLAIGAIGETGDFFQVQSGGVHVVYGGASGGLTASGNVLFTALAFELSEELADALGFALAAGDFDGDGQDDLAIGAPYKEVGAATQAGIVIEIPGSPSGLQATGAQVFDQNRIHGEGENESDYFGHALAAGDFDQDGNDDLAIGHPTEEVVGINDGAVTIVMGSADLGLDPEPNRHRFLSHGLEGVPGDPAESPVTFGYAVASGDFDGDGFADLAIGAPFESEASQPEVGTLTVLYGALFADGFEPATDFWSGIVSP